METSSTTHTTIARNPFLGLRPFAMEDSHLYFGRSTQVAETLDKLRAHHFVSIIGASGVGKSSFVYCGLLYTLQQEDQQWQFLSTRPGDAPLLNLAQVLSPITGRDAHAQAQEWRQGTSSPLQILAEAQQGQKFLLFIDQFEEVFRFREHSDEAQQEALAYIQHLTEIFSQRELPFYGILTMRSEFLDNCAQYPALTHYLNASQFLIPRMTREEIREAIEQPIRYMGAEIDPHLVERVLTDVNEEADQLPVMQHALMRTWAYWERTAGKGARTIGLADYEAIGGIKTALSVQANEIFMRLGDEDKKIIERVFKSIVEKGAEGRGIRRPTSVAGLAAIAGVSAEAIAKVVEPFRQTEAGLLMPAPPTPLSPDAVVDIAHESLMRIWETLSTWADKEAEYVKLYLRLADAAEKFHQGDPLWRPPDLSSALAWRDEQKPTYDWAVRHHPTVERTMLFLDASEKQYQKELDDKEKLQKRRLAQARYIAIASGIAVIICVLFLLYAIQKGEEAAQSLLEVNKQSEIAKKNAAEAKIQADKATIAKKAAEESAIEARRKSIEADEARKKAIASAEEALKAQRAALIEKRKAERSAEVAKINQQIAEINNQLAALEKEKADIARRDADNLRMISIAKALALKSIRLADNDLQALSAQQAFVFNYMYRGKPNDPDIYQGLYYAVKMLNNKEKPNYNQFVGHEANVRGLFAQGEMIYSAGSDGQVNAWQLGTQHYTQAYEVKPQILTNTKNVNRVISISPNGQRMIVAGEYPYLLLFENGKLKNQLPINANEIWYAAFSPNSQKLIAADDRKQIWMWDLSSSQAQGGVILESDAMVGALASHPSREVFAVGKTNGRISLYDYSGKEVLPFVSTRNIAVVSMAFDPLGTRLAIGQEDGILAMWNANTGQLIDSQKEHNARINAITFSRTSPQLATASFDKTVRIWNAENLNDMPIVLDDHNDWVWSIAFSGDGQKLLAGCRDNLIRVWPTQVAAMQDIICKEVKQQGRRQQIQVEEWERLVRKLEPGEEPPCICCQQ